METKLTPTSSFVPFRIIAKLFRLVELCLALVFIVWISARVPFAFRISCDCFRQLLFVISKPLFVFTLFNVIAATVIAMSRRLKEKNLSEEHFEIEFYEEIIKASETRMDDVKPKLSLPNEEEEGEEYDYDEANVFHDKQIISEVHSLAKSALESDSDSDSDSESEYPKVYRSTRLERAEREQCARDLRRVAAKKCWSSVEESPESLSPRNDLSSEEFQRIIDDFIAKQLSFRRQECLAVVDSKALVSAKSA